MQARKQLYSVRSWHTVKHTIPRIGGICAGLVTQGLFLVTIYHLFWFLRNGKPDEQPAALAVDSLLAVQFAIPHSVLLVPTIRRWLGRWIPTAFYGSFYCLVACVSLLVMCRFWRGSTPVLWNLTGWAHTLISLGFYASWVALIYSLHLTGLGYQTGWTTWWYWFRKQPLPKREFQPRGAYRFVRHPVYISFLGLIWFTPTMTLDHVILTGCWTLYIAIGSYLKDRRMLHYLGETYRAYAQQVAVHPFRVLAVPGGPASVLGLLSRR